MILKLYLEEEISFRIVCLGKIHPIDFENIKEHVVLSGHILTVEENTSDFGLGSEICYYFNNLKEFKNNYINKIGSEISLIPSSTKQEENILIDEKKIYNELINIINVNES